MTKSDILFAQMIIETILDKEEITSEDKSNIRKITNDFKESLDYLWNIMIGTNNIIEGTIAQKNFTKDDPIVKIMIHYRDTIAKGFKEENRYKN
jgi:hypothetical protein